MTRILSKITGIAILGLCLFMLNAGLQPATSHAACSNPAGVAADIVYNSSAKIFQYCDNTNWIRMNQVAGSGSGSCNLGGAGTVPEGTLFYNQDYRVLQGCAGNASSTIGATSSLFGWEKISVGVYHTCAIKADKTLHCWGGNGSGALGDGTTTTRSTPTPVSGAGTWKSVDAGYSHTCGIKSDDTLWCWGSNSNGELGDNSTTQRLVPTAISGGGTWKQVGVGLNLSCGIKSDDTLFCWGSNSNGRTGLNTSAGNTLVPTGINGGGTWAQVGVADQHACAVRSDNTLRCWGNNFNGQLGDNSTTQRLVPTAVSGGGSWKYVMGGYNHSCGIKSDDTLWCWGNNNSGRTGLGTAVGNTLVPTQISGGGTWKRIDTAQYNGAFSCGIKSDDTLWCWGYNYYGQLGDPVISTFGTTVPNLVAGGGAWKDVKVAQNTSCGLKADGSIRCWGSNNYGIIGNGTTADVYAPMAITGNANWQAISTGTASFGFPVCGIKSDNHLWCWGDNEYGMLGDGSNTTPDQPVEVSGSGAWKKTAAGGYHVCGIKSDDSLWCWGANSSGQLGTGGGTTNVPVAISGGGTWKEVSADGTGHTCGIKSDDSLWCWGRNDQGQIGDNSTTGRTIPVTVSGGGAWKIVDAGSNQHTCGIKIDNSLWCWGRNQYGEIGDNSTTQRLIPAAVSGGGSWKQVSAGGAHTCGIKSDDSLWCWGTNTSGQIGDGTTTSPRITPTALSGGGSWKFVGASDASTCAIKSDDTLWCWGSNFSGQLGDGTTTARLVPTAVIGGNTWSYLATGRGYTCAIAKSNGSAWCWGSNAKKQLTVTSTSSPYQTSGVSTACSSPTGLPGNMVYNTDQNILQYCDGVSWVGIGK